MIQIFITLILIIISTANANILFQIPPGSFVPAQPPQPSPLQQPPKFLNIYPSFNNQPLQLKPSSKVHYISTSLPYAKPSSLILAQPPSFTLPQQPTVVHKIQKPGPIVEIRYGTPQTRMVHVNDINNQKISVKKTKKNLVGKSYDKVFPITNKNDKKKTSGPKNIDYSQITNTDQVFYSKYEAPSNVIKIVQHDPIVQNTKSPASDNKKKINFISKAQVINTTNNTDDNNKNQPVTDNMIEFNHNVKKVKFHDPSNFHKAI